MIAVSHRVHVLFSREIAVSRVREVSVSHVRVRVHAS